MDTTVIRRPEAPARVPGGPAVGATRSCVLRVSANDRDFPLRASSLSKLRGESFGFLHLFVRLAFAFKRQIRSANDGATHAFTTDTDGVAVSYLRYA